MPERALAFDILWRDRQFNRGADQTRRKFREVERDSKRAGDGISRSFDQAEKGSDRFRQRLSGLGIAAGGAALAGLGVLGAGALKLATEFDDAYDTIRIGTGKTGKSLAGLKDDFRAVVRDVPTDFASASTAIGELNRRTGQTGKPLQGLAKRMLELTRLTGGDLSDNIALTTRLFGDWGIKTGQQSATLDKLFRASQATGVGIDQLATSVVKFGAPLRQLGFSFDQSIALLAKFEKEGVNSNLVMSGMRMALGKLAKAGKDPQQGFLELTQRIKDAGSSAAANRIAIEAFGQRAGPDMAAAIREGRLSIRDLQAQISGGKETILGAAKDAEDFGEKWKRVSNRLKLLAEPVVTAGLDTLSTKMGQLEGFLTKNLVPKLGELKGAWDKNKGAILGLLDPFDSVNTKSQTADERAQSLADSLTTVTEGAGKIARGLNNVERVLNEMNASFQQAGNDIHVHFVRPAVRAFGEMALSFAKLNHKLIAGAATVAEALHLPQARALRRAEQSMGAFVADARRDLDRLSAKAAETSSRVPGGGHSRFGQSLRAAERQAASLRQGFSAHANAIASKSADTAARVPGGGRSRFGQSLRAAERQVRGFRAAFNASIGALHGKRITIPIKGTFQPPKGFSVHSIVGATGGYVTPKAIVHRANGGPIRMGTGPKADDVPAMLSKGEYVINAKATAKHRGLVEAINRDGLRGYARGGGVDVDVLAPKMGRFAGRIQKLIDTVGRRMASALQRRLRIFVEGGVGKASILSFIRSVDRLPYVWGAAGPGAYDCSGLVGAVHGKMRGLRGAGRGLRLYTTASIRPGIHGLKSGLGGTLQIGVTAGSGHMAGRYGGLGFEAASSRTGIKVGATARRPESFARKYHLAKGGEVLARKVDELTRSGLLDVGGDAGKMRINGQVFDRGGTLAPGLNLLANRTGRPEPLVPAGRGLTRADAKMIAEELAKVIPSSIRVDDIHTGLLRKKNGRNGGVKLGLT